MKYAPVDLLIKEFCHKWAVYILLLPLALLLTFSPVYGQRNPNILLIMTDDQGWWDLGVHGNDIISTPVLDELSRESINFSHYYAAPVCSPTRAGMMTGRYHLRTGLYNTRFGGDMIDPEEITIAELLKTKSYTTGLFGKWHLGKYYDYQPNQQGFDEFFGHYHGHIEEYDYPDQLVHNGKPVEARKYVTDLFTDAAMDFIEENREKPFFCYLAYNAPHSPFVVGTSHGRQKRGDALVKKYIDQGLSMKNAQIYAMVEIIDFNMKRLLDHLEALDLEDNTIVIFASDNGGVSSHFRAGLRGNKGNVYEGGVRSPLMVRWPAQLKKKNVTVDAMVSHVDLLPTLCDIVDIPIPTDRKIDGKSFLHLLKDTQGESAHEYVYHHWDRYFPNPYNTWAVFDGRYKLLNNPTPWPKNPVEQDEPFGELYDLKADPGEQNNIARAHPEIVKRLRKAFVDYYDDVTAGREYQPAPIPIGNPRENPVEIQPSWGKISGDSIQYTFLGYDWDSVDSWQKKGEHIDWNLNVIQSGKYQVSISYGCSIKNAGGTIRISVNDEFLDFKVPATPSGDVFTDVMLGEIDIEKGGKVLRAEVEKPSGGEVVKLNRVWLELMD